MNPLFLVLILLSSTAQSAPAEPAPSAPAEAMDWAGVEAAEDVAPLHRDSPLTQALHESSSLYGLANGNGAQFSGFGDEAPGCVDTPLVQRQPNALKTKKVNTSAVPPLCVSTLNSNEKK